MGRQSARLISNQRKKEIFVALLTCVEKYLLNPSEPQVWAQEVFEQVTRLGGMVKKGAQQVSQLPDIVPHDIVRGVLQQLEENNPARTRSEREAQLRTAFPGSNPEIVADLGVGCMGEVSKVIMKDNGETQIMAAKTIIPALRDVFAQDREAFRTMPFSTNGLINVVRKFDSKGAAEMEAIIGKIADMADNDDMYQSILCGLDMQSESRQTLEASGHMGAMPGVRTFSVPKILGATQDVLLMELIEGQTLAKGAQVTVEPFVKECVNLYIDMMIGPRYFHQDLHPGNLLRTPAGKYVLLDWGEVVRKPTEITKDDVELLLKSVVCGTGDSLKPVFQRLGVETKPEKPDSPENYVALANLFNIPQALRGDPDVATDTVIKASSFR